MPEFTIKDFLDLGVAGLLAWLLLRERAENARLTALFLELAERCAGALEKSTAALIDMDDKRWDSMIVEMRALKEAVQHRGSSSSSRSVPPSGGGKRV